MEYINICNLNKRYSYSKKDERKILNNFSLKINKNEVYGIMGMSGSGKSTLLRILGGVESYDSGSISIDNIEYLLNDEKVSEQYRKEKIGFIYQDFNLLEGLTVKENILLPLTLEKFSEAEKEKIYDEIVEDADIRKIENRFTYEISGGQQQKAAIYRSLVKKPAIILADEPTGNLDPFSTNYIMQLLLGLNKNLNITILVVTHDFLAVRFCDRIGILSNGQIEVEYERSDMDDLQFMDFLIHKTGAFSHEREVQYGND